MAAKKFIRFKVYPTVDRLSSAAGGTRRGKEQNRMNQDIKRITQNGANVNAYDKIVALRKRIDNRTGGLREAQHMEIRKIQVGRKCFLVAVVDETETVITAGAFNKREEADTAVNMLFTFMAHRGLTDIKGYEPPNLKLDEVCEMYFQSSGRK